MANRQLQGAIFKLQGTSYLVLQDNQWDSDQLRVKSINPSRVTTTLPRNLIESQIAPGSTEQQMNTAASARDD